MSGQGRTSISVLDCGPDVRLGPLAGKVGLRNLGNTCFMNAGLQCICHLEPLAEYFLNARFEDDLNAASTGKNSKRKGSLARSFAGLLRELWQSRGQAQRGSGPASRIHSPKNFRDIFKELRPFLFENNEQQDVQEFIGFCLDGLNEDLNRVVSQPLLPSEQQRREDETLCSEKGEDFAAALSWHRHLEREKSFLVDLLQGQLRSSVTCKSCGHTSRKFEPFMYLSVPVEQTMNYMTDAIEKYLEEEVLTGEERWFCDRCKAKVEARKKIDLWFLPPVLVLHLKRFDSNLKKIEKRLKMKISSLDLSGFCERRQKDGAIYNVACVANHYGNYNSGHYTAVCRVGTPSSGTWHLFDDAEVTDLKDCRSVVTQQTYVVFLVRCPEDGAAAVRSSSASRLSTKRRDRPTLLRRQSTSKPCDWPHALSPAVKARDAATSAGVCSSPAVRGSAKHRSPSPMPELPPQMAAAVASPSRVLRRPARAPPAADSPPPQLRAEATVAAASPWRKRLAFRRPAAAATGQGLRSVPEADAGADAGTPEPKPKRQCTLQEFLSQSPPVSRSNSTAEAAPLGEAPAKPCDAAANPSGGTGVSAACGTLSDVPAVPGSAG